MIWANTRLVVHTPGCVAMGDSGIAARPRGPPAPWQRPALAPCGHSSVMVHVAEGGWLVLSLAEGSGDMKRRLVVAGGMVVFLFSSAIGVGVAHASGKITASGHIACFSFVGSVKFNPPLLTGGSSSTTASYKGTLNNCTDGGSGPAPAGITGGKVKGSVVLPTNSCASDPATPGSDMTIKWIGPHPITPSVIVAPRLGIDTVDSGGEAIYVLPENPPGESFMVTGSFAGVSQGVVEAFFDHEAAIATGCMPKTHGVMGSGGVKKATFGGPGAPQSSEFSI
jgi:hypothetical protein